MSENTHIGKRIQDCRKIKHLSQEELAEILEITQSYLSKIESGVEKPGRELLYRMCDVLDVSINYIYYGETEVEIENPRIESFISWLKKQPTEVQEMVLAMNEPVKHFLDEKKKSQDNSL